MNTVTKLKTGTQRDLVAVANELGRDFAARANGILGTLDTMNLYRRSSKPKQQAEPGRPRRPPAQGEEGTNAVQHRPDPKAEPIPDGEHKYVPRSPYRTGNS